MMAHPLMDKKTFVDKRVRGTYKINLNLTPQENINDILKLTMPIKLTLNKLQSGQSCSGSESFEMEGVSIKAIGNYRWSSCTDIRTFKRIHFSMVIPGRQWSRNTRNWSVPVRERENGEKIISLSHITNVFSDLSKLYQEGQKKEERRVLDVKLAQERLENLRSKSRLPQEIDLRQIGATLTDKERLLKPYRLHIDLSGLSEKQVIELSPILVQALAIKKKIG